MSTISNIPAALNWKIYKGDTARLTIFMQDSTGEAIDLTDYVFTGEIKAQQEELLPLQTITIVANASFLSLEIADTATLPKISYFDIQSVNAGITWTILKGTINVEQDVTE